MHEDGSRKPYPLRSHSHLGHTPVSKQMKHPKAKNEFPEDVKKRAEETRRKLKKPNDEIMPTEEEDEDEASEQGGEALLEPVPTNVFHKRVGHSAPPKRLRDDNA
jgi:hypothetical protein